MDKHDVAHYGIAAALAAAVGTGAYVMPHAQKTWPTLTDKQAISIVRIVHEVIPKDIINVYCIDRECNGIARKLRWAGDQFSGIVHTDRPIQAEDGLTVGAKTQELADNIAKAVRAGSGGTLDPKHTAVVDQPPYISFGHFVDDEK